MPPLTRGNRKPPGYWAGSSSNRRPAKRRGRKVNYASSKPRQYGASTRGKSGPMNMLRIATNVPKSSNIRLRYNQTVLLRGNTEEQYRFRIQMNNPNGQGPVDLISEISGAPTVFTNAALNLSQQMNDLFDQYDHAVVTQSVVNCNIRPYGNNPKTGITYVSTPGTSAQPGNFLQDTPPEVHGDLMAWAVLSDRTNAFVSTVIPTATLRNDTPGVKQRSLMCFKDMRKGVSFQQKYNPKTAFGIKDVGDNQTRIGFTPSSGPNERIFADIGIQPVIPFTMAGTGPSKMPNLYVTFQVDYVINFTERRPQANVARPTAHFAEL